MFRGSIPALVTPFRDEALDEAAYRDFVTWQIARGKSWPRPGRHHRQIGDAEARRSIAASSRSASRRRRARCPVIAGCGSNDTAHAIALTSVAKECGADAALHVPPYYNRPNQEGIYAHLAAIAEAVDIPIILYNVPSRTMTDIAVETMARLAKIANIVAVKDATGNLARVTAQRLACGEDFIQLSGNDDMALGFIAMGGTGLHLGHRQRRAAALRRFRKCLLVRRLGRGLETPGQALSPPRRPLQRRVAGTGQICAQQAPPAISRRRCACR